jgi:ATP-dependent helicase/nuclease subunit A
VLVLRRPAAAGLRLEDVLHPDGGSGAAEAGAAAHEAWSDGRAAAIAGGTTSERSVITVTEAARRAGGGKPAETGEPLDSSAPDVMVVEGGAPRSGRPHGRRFGSLVHGVLAGVGLEADEREVAAAAEAQGRVVGASEEEVAAATAVVTSTLGHPLLREAAALPAAFVMREVPVLLNLAPERHVEGVVDLVFKRNESWVVIDFKTDVELAGRRAEYEAQVAWYARAVAAATGAPTAAVLLVV